MATAENDNLLRESSVTSSQGAEAMPEISSENMQMIRCWRAFNSQVNTFQCSGMLLSTINCLRYLEQFILVNQIQACKSDLLSYVH